MIHRVALYFILPMCLIAFFLSAIGVQQITLGDSYYNFLQGVSNTFNNWSFSIPDIPKIDTIATSSYNSSGLILQVLIKIANFFVKFVNIIIGILNIITSILNVVIGVIQFILTIIYECRNFINKFRSGIVVATM